MSWSYLNADTYAAISSVGALPQNGAPISVWWMIRPAVSSDFGVYVGLESGSDRLGILSVIGKYFTTGDGAGGPTPVVSEWQIIGYDDNNGGGGTVRWHHCTDLDGTPTWAHSDGTAGGDRSGVVDVLRLGIAPGGFRMRGHIAAGAIAAGRLGDAGFEALGVTDMATWVAAADLAWQMNVSVGSTALADLTGGGADQTSLTGTPTLDNAEEPPNWTYFSAGPNEGSAAFTLDLAPAAVGGRQSAGSAAVGLGLAVAATGARASRGAAAIGLGIGVTATGARASRGQAALAMTLAVAAVGPGSGTVVHPPRTGSIARPDTGIITVPRLAYP